MDTPQAAFHAFLAARRQLLSCVTYAPLVAGTSASGRTRFVTLGSAPARLRGAHGFGLLISEWCEAVSVQAEDDRWEMRLRGYVYELVQRDGPLAFSYHWHPLVPAEYCAHHLHISGAERTLPDPNAAPLDYQHMHLPTGRISLQAVLHGLILGFGVEPLLSNWESILNGR
jgi:hypothetical protein